MSNPKRNAETNEKLNFNVPKRIKIKLEMRAANTGRSIASLAREAIERQYADKRPATKD